MKNWERKHWLLALVLVGLVIVAVPSAVLIGAVEDYMTFLTGTRPPPLPSTKPRFLPRPEIHRKEPDIRMVRFALSAPKAKEVRLTGDFNGWDDGLTLERRPRGDWQTVVPLPTGTYHYLFRVDGRWSLDPEGRPAHLGAQPVSERVVK